ncbi:MAG: DUF3857 domain-containing protein [Bacteroidota bacterium]
MKIKYKFYQSISRTYLLGTLALMTLAGGQQLKAADDYRISSIPEKLLEQADAVVRKSEKTLSIRGKDKGTYRVHQAVTVLNTNGDKYAFFAVWYNPQRKIKSIDCTVYDARGQVVKKVKNKDIEDVSAISSFSIYEDDRVKYYDYDASSYPYTVEYSYEIEFDGFLSYPDWNPVTGFRLAVEQSVLQVNTPTDLPLRYKIQRTDEPAISTEGGLNYYRWTLAEQPAYEKEEFMPDLDELTPQVFLAPGEFAYEGFAGNQSSWQEIGAWINTLNQDRDQLPQTTLQEIKQRVENLSDTSAIIQSLYEYMQSKTRYVSIQLGIGGYQPFKAAEVDRLGYGDCKALSNYMKSILAVVGIDSRYTLVNAGPRADKVTTDFPSLKFNHAILGVPLSKDTIWLECTSQTNPFGHLGDFTDNRNVLMVDETGGRMVKTSAYSSEDNQQISNARMKLDEQGNGLLTVQTLYSGQLYDDIAYIARLNDTEQKQAAYEQVSIPNFRLEQFDYTLEKGRIPRAKESMSIKLDRYASVSGKRWFFSPNVMSRLESLPANTEGRKYPVVLRYTYTKVDTTIIEFPENLYPEFVPEPTEIHSEFGKYRSEHKVEQGNILYIRMLQRNKGTFPSESYSELLKFYEEVSKADRQQFVLRKNT